MSEIRKYFAVIAGAIALAGSGGALAQNGEGQGAYGQQGGTSQQPQAPSNFSDDQLQSFAEAQQQVAAIGQKFQQRIQGADDPSQMAEMRQKANTQMVEAVRDAGLEPATYNAIANAVRSNPDMAEKIENMQ